MSELSTSAELMRHELASIDLSDILTLLKERLTDDEAMEVANTVEVFYKTTFKNRIKLLLQAQMEFMSKEAVNELQLQFARGTFNGIKVIDEWFEEQVALSLSRLPDPKTEQTDTPISPIGHLT